MLEEREIGEGPMEFTRREDRHGGPPFASGRLLFDLDTWDLLGADVIELRLDDGTILRAIYDRGRFLPSGS